MVSGNQQCEECDLAGSRQAEYEAPEQAKVERQQAEAQHAEGQRVKAEPFVECDVAESAQWTIGGGPVAQVVHH